MAQQGHFMDFSCEESGLVAVPIQWTSGATGAVPALSTFRYKQHIVSVTRNSAGNYTVVYDTNYVGFIGTITEHVIQATPTAGGLFLKITAHNIGASAALSLTVQVAAPNGTATDPANGDVVVFTPVFQYMDAIAGL